MAPFADTVGFVDGQPFEIDTPQRFEEPWTAEPFGHDVDQFVGPVAQGIEPGVLFRLREGAVDERGPDA